MPVDVMPTVDEERISSIFNELLSMEVLLDEDPLAYGPKHMNKKVAICRGLLTRCEQIFLQVAHDLARLKNHHRQAQMDFELQMQELFANDIEVRSGRNVRDREAVATIKLRTERERIMSLEASIHDLEAVQVVVKAKRADLKDIQGRIKDQMKLCDYELGLGRRWGSKAPPGANVPNIDMYRGETASDVDTINEITAGAEGETHLGVLEDIEQMLENLVGDDETNAGTSNQVGLCDVCGDPLFLTHNGTSCKNGHGEEPAQEEPVQEEPAQEESAQEESAQEELDIVDGDNGDIALIPTVTEDEVDAFLDGIDDPPPPPNADTKKSDPPPPTSFDEVDLDDLLGSFE